MIGPADVIKAAVCRVLGLSLDRHAAFDIDAASLSTIVAWDGGGKVLSVNAKAAA
jgi:probable phosphoglycerate mutase